MDYQSSASRLSLTRADSLIALAKRAGFVEVGRRDCYDNHIAGIRESEDESQILNGEGVCVEGVKPSC